MLEGSHVTKELIDLVETQKSELAHVMGLQDADGETLAEAMDALHSIVERLDELAVRVEALERIAKVGES